MFNSLTDFFKFFIFVSGFEEVIKKVPSRFLRTPITILMYPFIFIVGGLSMLSGKKMWEKDRDGFSDFEDEVSIVAIAKNEGDYIKEWIDYHSLLGISKFYIYDNESSDATNDILLPYIESGKVIYQMISGKGKQHEAYNHAIKNYKEKTRYMVFIDCDEFIMPLEETQNNLVTVITGILEGKKNVGGLGVNWNVYGSSGHETKPDGLIIENYLYRTKNDGNFNDRIKSVVNPRLVKKMLTHYPVYHKGIYTISEKGKVIVGPLHEDFELNKIRINHYFTKSKEEWTKRRNLGKADHTDDAKRSIDQFYENDSRDVYDVSMLRFSDKIKDFE